MTPATLPEDATMNDVIYVYGFRAGRRTGSNGKPELIGSINADELDGCLADAARLGYVGVFHQTTSRPYNTVRHASGVVIGRGV